MAVRTVAEAAEKLGCSESSIYQMVAVGSLRCYRIGKRGIRFTDEALDEYMAGEQGEQSRHVRAVS